MRFKINENLSSAPGFYGISDYYRYFKYYFDYFLNPRPDFDKLIENENIYIENEKVETLLSFVRDEQSYCQLLVGHTGIGKSTIIRNYFKLFKHTPQITDDTIIVPYFCDNLTEDLSADVFFASNLQYVADELIKKLEKPIDKEVFWHFIHDTKPEVLTRHRKGEYVSWKDDLTILMNDGRFAYSSFLLKYLLSFKENSCFKHIVLILDDIESIDNKNVRKSYINFAYHAYECLKNKDNDIHIKLIIAERPHTREEFHSKDWEDQKSDIDIWHPPAIEKLFEIRHKYVLSKIATDAIDRPSWQTSYEFLCFLLNKIERFDGGLFLGLNNFDVRKSLRSVEYCLSQGTWFQTTKPKSEAFTIDGRTIAVHISSELILKETFDLINRETYKIRS